MKIQTLSRPMVLFLTVSFFLAGAAFLPHNVDLGLFSTKKFLPYIDVLPDSLQDEIFYELDNTESVSLAEVTSMVQGSAYQGLEQVIEAYRDGKLTEAELSSALTNVGISGNVQQLSHFFKALKNSKSSKVRIAYFGDSGIEGDNITADFREIFQSQYGGQGVGFLSITSQDISFRSSIKQTFSNDWNAHSISNPGKVRNPVGFNGSVAVPKSGSWVNFEGTFRYKTVRQFNTARILYSDAKSSSIDYWFGSEKKSAQLKPGGFQELVLTSSADVKSFKFAATQADQAKFYGVSLESGNGVYVDNFPIRGNTGVGLRDISAQMHKDFDRILGYKLIILHFGMNILDGNSKDFGWYERDMAKIVSQLKSDNPDCSILIIGVGDRSQKRGTSLATHPNVKKVLDAQKQIAQDAGVAIWSLFDAMGGENTMVRWAAEKPALASQDYTHYTLEGAKKVADLLASALLNEAKKF